MRNNLNQSKSVGLVLSGGGVRGVAHVGMLKALEEHDISVSALSGSSVGALVGALYAHIFRHLKNRCLLLPQI